MRWMALWLGALLLGACGGSAAPSQGQQLYAAHCAACHGAQGEGAANWQQPLPDGTLPAPPHDGSGHTWHHADVVLLQIIAQGGKGPNSRMPGFAERLSESEQRLVLDYIKGFWSAEQRTTQSDISRRYERLAP